MTLLEAVPTLGHCLTTALPSGLWPASTERTDDGDLLIGGVRLAELAARYGTPAQVLDLTEVERRLTALRTALPDAEIAYAGKALLCRGLLRLLSARGCSLDVCSAGELAVARAAGFPAERIVLHGNAKTAEDIKAALDYGVGRIVLDSPAEAEMLGGLVPRLQSVLVRVTPGVDARTHKAITTGTSGQKFGVDLADAQDVVAAVLAQPHLRLVGLHCHVGSQVTGVDVYEEAARRMVRLLGRVHDRFGRDLPQLDLGGGFAIRYRPDDPDFDLTGYAQRVGVAVAFEAARAGIPRPGLTIEPGRWLVGPAGVTLYRVVSVKGRFVAVDGGMSDNPRPALYGARYSVRMVGRRTSGEVRPVTVVGRHCEAGDVLADDVALPTDVHPGDVLAVPATGAYHLSMASNYNAVTRPPLVAVRDGVAELFVRRETERDLLRRDVG